MYQDNFYFTDSKDTSVPRSYQEVQHTYDHHPLGRKVAEAIVKASVHGGRTWTFTSQSPSVSSYLTQKMEGWDYDNIIYEALVTSRVFGYSVIYFQEDKPTRNEDLSKPLTTTRFTPVVYTPYHIKLEFQLDMGPSYGKITKATSQGSLIHPTRYCPVYEKNLSPIRFTPYNFTRGPLSVYHNIWNFLKILTEDDAAIARNCKLQQLAILTTPSGESTWLEKKGQEKADKIAKLPEYSALVLDEGSRLEPPPTRETAANEHRQMIKADLCTTLGDTTQSMLTDKAMSTGFAEGSPDYLLHIQKIEEYRTRRLKPLYDYMDNIIMRATFNNGTLDTLRIQHPTEYSETLFPTNDGFYEHIKNSFTYKFSDLIPQDDTKKLSNESIAIQNAMNLHKLGAPFSVINEYINSKKLIEEPFELESPRPDAFDQQQPDNITPW